MTQKRKVWISAMLGLLALGGGYVAMAGGEGRALGARLETATAERGDMERIVAATGSVRPLVTVEIGSELSGRVEALFVDFNDTVTAGQVIARIDPRTFAARVEQAEADLKLAKAGLETAAAAMVRAKANLELAQRDFARTQRLAANGNMSESALDTARAALAVAEADISAAKAQQVTADATVAQRRAALQQARIDLERSDIRSSIDGVVVNRAVDVGQTVAASLSAPILFEIAQDLRSIQIEASVDEADIGLVRPGSPVRFSVDAYPDRDFAGAVRQVRLAPVELNNVVTYTVVIAAENADRALLPGMTANLEVVVGRSENALRVPNAALRLDPPAALRSAASDAGAARGGQGFGAMAEQLDLTEAQQDKLRAAMADMRRSFRTGGDATQATGGAAGDGQAQFRQQFQRILSGILTPEQLEKYRSLQAGREAVRMGTVWVPDTAGGLKSRRVRLGLSNTRFTEILDGLPEGSTVVTRIREDMAGET